MPQPPSSQPPSEPPSSEPPSGAQPVAGWYPNPTGAGQRYWDGAQWTNNYQQVPGAKKDGGGLMDNWRKLPTWGKWAFAVGAIIVIAAIASGGGQDSNKNDSSSTAQVQTESNPATESTSVQTVTQTVAPKPAKKAKPAPAPVSNGPTAKLPISDGDWRLDSVNLKDDGLGDFGGSGRVTYTGTSVEGGNNLFTLTVFVGGKQVGVLNGSANGVKAGDAVTVELISQDKFVNGPYKFDFQNDI